MSNVYIGVFFFLRNLFNNLRYNICHRDHDLWLKVTNINSVWARYIAKIASKSIHPFGWNFVHYRQTHTQINCHEYMKSAISKLHNLFFTSPQKTWNGQIFIPVCLSVSVYLSDYLPVNEFAAKLMYQYWCNFCRIVVYRNGSNLFKIGDRWSKVYVPVTC